MNGFAFIIGCVLLGLCLDHGLTNVATGLTNVARAIDRKKG